MGDLTEIIITSDVNGSLWSCCAWDPQVGTHLCTYKGKIKIIPLEKINNEIPFFQGGGATAAHALSYINNEFIITADNSKPLLHIWPVNSQEQITGQRFVVPGKVTALTISPDGVYCIAAVGAVIYIWRISSGSMMSMISRHYQSVTTLKFTDDGSHFISAGQDGMMLVWKLSNVLTTAPYKEPNPIYPFSDHTLPITDVAIGIGGMRALIASASMDRSCRIYDLASGVLLLNLVFPHPLTSITIDRLDTKVYVGTSKGHIFEFSLQSPPRAREYHVSLDVFKSKQLFIGHKGAVTSLSISLDGETLLSGSTDENVHMWHIPSKQLIRAIPHKGAITNAKFVLAPKAMFDQEQKLNLIINGFKRMLDKTTPDEAVEILVTNSIDPSIDDDAFQGDSNSFVETNAATPKNKSVNGFNGSIECNLSEIDQLRAEVHRLKKINKELFEHSMKNLLENNK